MSKSMMIRTGVASALAAVFLFGSFSVLAANEADTTAATKKEKRQNRRKERQMNKGGAASWRIGIQAYTFHKFSLFEAIDKAKELELKYIEIYPGQKLSPDRADVKFNHGSSKELREEVKAKLKAADLKAVSYGVVKFNDEDEARKVFEFARDMGMETVVSEPENKPELWAMLDKITQEYKINLAIHNHPKAPKSLYWDPKTVLEVVKDLNPRIGACADTGHWMRSGIDPLEALKMLEGRIIELHFKDLNEVAPKAHDVPWGTGKGDVKALLRELDRQKFSGVFLIEYEHNLMNSMPDMAECIKFFKQAQKELAAKAK